MPASPSFLGPYLQPDHGQTRSSGAVSFKSSGSPARPLSGFLVGHPSHQPDFINIRESVRSPLSLPQSSLEVSPALQAGRRREEWGRGPNICVAT
ncbi:mu-type opioid receptor [Sarotherodon galilaeus]